MVLKEPELFSYLKEFYYPDLTFTSDKYSTYDCVSQDNNLYIELKSRNKHYDELLIEQVKWDGLTTEARYFNLTPYYVCSTPDGIWAFDLSKWKPEWEEKWLPQNTEFSARGNKTKVVGYLHIKDGVAL